MFTVEVRVIGGELATSMTQMRTWFDHQGVEPDAFRHSTGGTDITFRVDFKLEPEALNFARAFSGRVIGMSRAQEGVADRL